ASMLAPGTSRNSSMISPSPVAPLPPIRPKTRPYQSREAPMSETVMPKWWMPVAVAISAAAPLRHRTGSDADRIEEAATLLAALEARIECAHRTETVGENLGADRRQIALDREPAHVLGDLEAAVAGQLAVMKSVLEVVGAQLVGGGVGELNVKHPLDRHRVEFVRIVAAAGHVVGIEQEAEVLPVDRLDQRQGGGDVGHPGGRHDLEVRTHAGLRRVVGKGTEALDDRVELGDGSAEGGDQRQERRSELVAESKDVVLG